jgi:hypothetical protein
VKNSSIGAPSQPWALLLVLSDSSVFFGFNAYVIGL